MKDYKVETKPTYWQVILSSGVYSDYTEEHLFFAGNSQEEIWNFLCRYMDDIIVFERDYTYSSVYDGEAYLMKFEDKKFIAKKFIGDKEDIDWSSKDDIADVVIQRLNIIYFKK
jgi:hypothetical protein